MIETKTAIFSYLEESVILVTIKEGAEIDVPEVQENIATNQKLTQGRSYAVLVDGTTSATITKEGAEYAGRPEHMKNLIAQAIFTKSLANTIIANMIMKFNSKYRLTKVFSDRDKALKWLREEVEKSKEDKDGHSTSNTTKGMPIFNL